MHLSISINKNNDRRPYVIREFNGEIVVSEKPANVLAYYDVTLINTSQMSIFSYSTTEKQKLQLDECDFVFSDKDYPLRKYLIDQNIPGKEVDEIIEVVLNKIEYLYFEKKDSTIIEITI